MLAPMEPRRGPSCPGSGRGEGQGFPVKVQVADEVEDRIRFRKETIKFDNRRSRSSGTSPRVWPLDEHCGRSASLDVLTLEELVDRNAYNTAISLMRSIVSMLTKMW
jgi:hypothetical protein